MFRSTGRFGWREAIPRVLADLAVVYLSMAGALALSVLYQTTMGDPNDAPALIGELRRYYLRDFSVLALIFPVTFFMNGFYTHSRAYSDSYKLISTLRGVLMGVAFFLTASFVFFTHQPFGRSAALAFSILATIGCSSIRFSKTLLERQLRSTPSQSPAVTSNSEDRVLVLGGAGYIGSALVDQLLQRGRRVRVLDTLLYGISPLEAFLNDPRLEVVPGDCRHIPDVVDAMRGVKEVVHLAAIVGDPACAQDEQTALEVNYAATRMIIEIAKAQKVSRFIFASSCSVYGARSFEVDEMAEPAALSLYAQTKIDSERALLMAADAGFYPVTLRFATLFGLSQRPRFDLVVNLLAAKAYQEKAITIFNGTQWRPFLHVKDAAAAICRVLEAPALLISGEIFNVGDRRLNYTLAEIGEMIRKFFPETRIETVDNNDRRDYKVNFDKIRKRLAFRCNYTLEDGIRECKKAFEEGLISDYHDALYHNQATLQSTGRLPYRGELDAQIMAAFATPLSDKGADSKRTAPLLVPPLQTRTAGTGPMFSQMSHQRTPRPV
jgi:nucleoside-diphosphate-sugar epimerase